MTSYQRAADFNGSSTPRSLRDDGQRSRRQADYAPLAPAARSTTPSPAIVALPVPRPRRGAPPGVRQTSTARCPMPSARHRVAIDEKERVEGLRAPERRLREARPIAASYRRAVPAIRRFGADITRDTDTEARALRTTVGGGVSRTRRWRPLSGAAAIEWPDDELSFATRSLLAIDDEHLLEFAIDSAASIRSAFRRLAALTGSRADERADGPPHATAAGCGLGIASPSRPQHDRSPTPSTALRRHVRTSASS